MKKILITGASGFLGEKIFETLNSLGKYEIVLGARNPSRLKAHTKFSTVDARIFDIGDSSTYESALKGIDIVVHLAAMDYADCEKNPELARKINVDCLRSFAHTCSVSGVNQFIYFSTFHVYGPNAVGLITEETKVNPVNTYSLTHYEAEQIVLADKSLNGIVIRLSNAIGAPLFEDSSAWKLVVNDLCRQAVKSKKIVLNSSGKQLRDFIPACDIGNAVDVLISKNAVGVFNLGSGRSVSILDIAHMIQDTCQKIYNTKPDLTVKQVENEKISSFSFSNEKIQRLGFKFSSNDEKEIAKILSVL